MTARTGDLALLNETDRPRAYTLKQTLLAAATLAAAPDCVAAQPRLTAADSAAVVQAAWHHSADAHVPRRAVWLWTPPPGDTLRGVPLSPAVRRALAKAGVPVSDRRPAGDDTVVFRLVEWRSNAGGIRLEVWSEWTTVLGTGARRCRTGSGNRSGVQVQRVAGAWVAMWDGPQLHGDRVCNPIRESGAVQSGAV